MKGGGTTIQATTPAWQDCVHSKGGVCSVHGKGALLRWKPSAKKTSPKVEGGRSVDKYEGKYNYVCDLGLDDGRKLK